MTQSGTYYAVGTTATCSDTSNTVLVQVVPSPLPNITGNPTPITGSSLAYSTPLVSGDTYAWSIIGGNITSGQGTSTVQVTWGLPGTAHLAVHEAALSTCSGNDTLQVQVTSNIGIEEASSSVFTISPNPASGILRVTASQDLSGTVVLEIRDVLGALVRSERPVSKGGASLDIDVSSLAEGSYSLRISIGEKLWVSRFVVQR